MWSSDRARNSCTPSSMPVADPRDRGPGDPGLVAQGPHEVVDLAGGDPLDPRGADHGVQGLVHPLAGVEQGGEERPRAQLGDRELDLAGGGGHGLGPRAVAAVGALRRALVALRADHGGGLGVDQVLQPGPEQTSEDVIVSQIRVGQDFPDQRGHGRLVTGHRGCTPCESWSRNRAPTMPPPVPTTPGGSPAGIATTLRDAPRRRCAPGAETCISHSRVRFQPSFSSAKCTSRRGGREGGWLRPKNLSARTT